MVKRYFGGVMSLTKPVANSSSASGMFSASSQIQLQAAGNWPSPPAPTLEFDFPSAYQSEIDTFVGTTFYVASTGNDSNVGTKSSPFATVDRAHTAREGLPNSDVMIVIGTNALSTSVTYSVTPRVTKEVSGVQYGSCILFDYTSNRTVYVCVPGKVILSWTALSTARDAAVVYFDNANSRAYGAIFKRNNNGKTNSYECSFANGETSEFNGSLYNCVLQEVNANNNWSMGYDNTKTATGSINYCSFFVGKAGLQDYTAGPQFVVANSVFNYTYWTGAPTTNGGGLTYTNPQVLGASKMNSTTYTAPGVTTAGVWYGTYAWV